MCGGLTGSYSTALGDCEVETLDPVIRCPILTDVFAFCPLRVECTNALIAEPRPRGARRAEISVLVCGLEIRDFPGRLILSPAPSGEGSASFLCNFPDRPGLSRFDPNILRRHLERSERSAVALRDPFQVMSG